LPLKLQGAETVSQRKCSLYSGKNTEFSQIELLGKKDQKDCKYRIYLVIVA